MGHCLVDVEIRRANPNFGQQPVICGVWRKEYGIFRPRLLTKLEDMKRIQNLSHSHLRWDNKKCAPLKTLTATPPGLQWVQFYSPDSCTANRWVQPSTVLCMGLFYWHPHHPGAHSPQWKCFLAGKQKKKSLMCFNRYGQEERTQQSVPGGKDRKRAGQQLEGRWQRKRKKKAHREDKKEKQKGTRGKAQNKSC